MLKDIIIDITNNIHEIGHHGTQVDSMMDSVSGMGHRIKEGHDLQGLIEAFHLEGIEGIGLWFDHMLKDFTSPQGIPLPFSEAIYEATGMEMDEAVDWLTINASDVLELGGQALLMNYFKDNPKIYKSAIVLGIGLGLIDDNPLLIAYNTFHCLKMYKDSGENIFIIDKSLSLMRKGMDVSSKICRGAAVVDIGMGLVGLNLTEMIENSELVFPVIDGVIDGATIAADIVDGAATLGIGIIASQAVKYTAEKINGDLQTEYEKNAIKSHVLSSLAKLLESGASPSSMFVPFKYIQSSGWVDINKLEG